jgi:hypothetical protein
MPIANVSNHATPLMPLIKDLSPPIHKCPERPEVCAQAQPPFPQTVINWGQKRQRQGGGHTNRKSFRCDERVLALVPRSASFRDPHAAFFTAIRPQFPIARGGGHCSRQTHRPAAARAQMLLNFPTHSFIVTYKPFCAVITVTVDRDF